MVDVLVQVFDRGEVKRIVVPVEEECFDPEKVCWKGIANIKAAALLGLPFTLLDRAARYGMRPADKARLRVMYGGDEGTAASTGDGSTDCHGPSVLAMTDERREEASA